MKKLNRIMEVNSRDLGNKSDDLKVDILLPVKTKMDVCAGILVPSAHAQKEGGYEHKIIFLLLFLLYKNT